MELRGADRGAEGCGQQSQGVQTTESRVRTMEPRGADNGVEGCGQRSRGVRTMELRDAGNGQQEDQVPGYM